MAMRIDDQVCYCNDLAKRAGKLYQVAGIRFFTCGDNVLVIRGYEWEWKLVLFSSFSDNYCAHLENNGYHLGDFKFISKGEYYQIMQNKLEELCAIKKCWSWPWFFKNPSEKGRVRP